MNARSNRQPQHKLPLDEDDEEAQEGAGEVLKVNKAYAARLEHNKKREALHRLQELQKQGLVASSDESSDDDDDNGLLPAQTEARFFEALAKIKNRDPSIYSQETKFFDDMEEEDGDDANEGRSQENKQHKKKPKPVYLKDALAHQLIENGPDFIDGKIKKEIITYAEEQQALKDEFLQSAAGAEDDEEDAGFLKLRKKSSDIGNGLEEEGEEEKQTEDAAIARRLEEYFGADDKLDDNEKFLKEYLRKKSWIVPDDDRIPSYDEIVGDIREDEEELEKQDRFEAEYNFRHEGDHGWQVMGHSRVVEDSVRRKDDSRRLKRMKKKERLFEAAFERQQELKRLKNIKKKEILQKLEKIRIVAGANESDTTLLQSFESEDLEEDFNPEEYDRKMREAFGEEYYGADDVDENFQGYEDMEKPDFEAEDELLGLPKGWVEDEDEQTGKSGFVSVHAKVKEIQTGGSEQNEEKEDLEGSTEIEEDEDSEGTAGNTEENKSSERLSKRKRKARISLREKLAFDKQLEEYYKLDYEDVIGDLPTRFKYRQVKPNTFGLTTSEILSADDKELNQYVSLKKLAPYVTEEFKPKWRFQGSQKARKKRALRQHVSSQGANHTESNKDISVKMSQSISSVKNLNVDNAEGAEGYSKKKRKRRKKGLSLSESRLIAYGKISLPSKKRRHG